MKRQPHDLKIIRHTVVVLPLMKPISHVYYSRTVGWMMSTSQIAAEMGEHMNKEEFITAIDKANITFKKIMVNYPGLKGYLVLSSPYGQCELTGDPLQILKDFPP